MAIWILSACIVVPVVIVLIITGLGVAAVAIRYFYFTTAIIIWVITGFMWLAGDRGWSLIFIVFVGVIFWAIGSGKVDTEKALSEKLLANSRDSTDIDSEENNENEEDF